MPLDPTDPIAMGLAVPDARPARPPLDQTDPIAMGLAKPVNTDPIAAGLAVSDDDYVLEQLQKKIHDPHSTYLPTYEEVMRLRAAERARPGHMLDSIVQGGIGMAEHVAKSAWSGGKEIAHDLVNAPGSEGLQKGLGLTGAKVNTRLAQTALEAGGRAYKSMVPPAKQLFNYLSDKLNENVTGDTDTESQQQLADRNYYHRFIENLPREREAQRISEGEENVVPEWTGQKPYGGIAEVGQFFVPVGAVEIGTAKLLGKLALSAADRAVIARAAAAGATTSQKINLAARALAATGDAVAGASGKVKGAADWTRTAIPRAADKVFGTTVGPKVVDVLKRVPGAETVSKVAGLTSDIAGAAEKGGEGAAYLGRNTVGNSQFSRMEQLATDPNAPAWIQSLARTPAARAAETTARAGKTFAQRSALGAGLGGALGVPGALDSEHPGEEIGQSAAGGVVLVNATHLATHPLHAKMIEANARRHDILRMTEQQLKGGQTLEWLKENVSDDVMLQAATIYRALHGQVDILFTDAGGFQKANLDPRQAGHYDTSGTRPTIRVRADANRNAQVSFLHEVGHHLAASEVGRVPGIKADINRYLGKMHGGDVQAGLDLRKRQLAERLLGTKNPDPAVQRVLIDAKIAELDKLSEQKHSGDRNHWIYEEIFAEGVAKHWGKDSGVDLYKDILSEPSIARRIARFFGRGSQEQKKTFDKSRIFDENSDQAEMDAPEIGQAAADMLRDIYRRAPALHRGKVPEYTLNRAHLGTPLAPLHDNSDEEGRRGNDVAFEMPGTGDIVQRSAAQTAKLGRKRGEDTLKAAEVLPVVADPLDKATFGRRVDPLDGKETIGGTEIGNFVNTVPTFSAEARSNAQIIQGSFGGKVVKFVYHQVGTGKGSTYDTSLRKVRGGFSATIRKVVMIGWRVSARGEVDVNGKRVAKGGNLVVDALDLSSAEPQAAEWKRLGKLNNSLYNGDVGALLADLHTYAKNHAAGLMGEANGLGRAKADFLATFILGGKGKGETGLIRSFRLDRIESAEFANEDFAPAEYQKKKDRYSPDEALPSPQDDRISPAVPEPGQEELAKGVVAPGQSELQFDASQPFTDSTAGQSALPRALTAAEAQEISGTLREAFDAIPKELATLRQALKTVGDRQSVLGQIRYLQGKKDATEMIVSQLTSPGLEQFIQAQVDGINAERAEFHPTQRNQTRPLMTNRYLDGREDVLRAVTDAANAKLNPPEPAPQKPGGARYSPDEEAKKPDAFYSRLTRSVEQSKQGRATGQQWKSIIKNSKLGANADEMSLISLDELFPNDQTFTREQALAVMKSHEIKAETVILGEPKTVKGSVQLEARGYADQNIFTTGDVHSVLPGMEEGKVRVVIREDKGNWPAEFKRKPRKPWVVEEVTAGHEAVLRDPDHTDTVAQFKTYEEAQSFVTKNYKPFDETVVEDPTHFGDYPNQQLPGAKPGSYREVLLTVPDYKKAAPPAVDPKDQRYVIKLAQGQMSFATRAEAEAEQARLRKWHPTEMSEIEVWNPAPQTKITWLDGHDAFDGYPNPIVRLRYTERQTTDGRKMLFLEEVQPPLKGEFEKMPPLFQKTWRETAFKWALRHAAEKGFDSIGWTTGEQQVARNDLSKHLSRVELRKVSEKLVSIIGYGPRNEHLQTNGHRVIEKSVAPAELSKYIGKDLAAKFDAMPWSSTMPSPLTGQPTALQGKILDGLDLRVGGEGLRKLYDVDFRNVVQSLPAVKRSGTLVASSKIPSSNVQDKAVQFGENGPIVHDRRIGNWKEVDAGYWVNKEDIKFKGYGISEDPGPYDDAFETTPEEKRKYSIYREVPRPDGGRGRTTEIVSTHNSLAEAIEALEPGVAKTTTTVHSLDIHAPTEHAVMVEGQARYSPDEAVARPLPKELLAPEHKPFDWKPVRWVKNLPVFTGKEAHKALFARFGIPNGIGRPDPKHPGGRSPFGKQMAVFVDDAQNGKPIAIWDDAIDVESSARPEPKALGYSPDEEEKTLPKNLRSSSIKPYLPGDIDPNTGAPSVYGRGAPDYEKARRAILAKATAQTARNLILTIAQERAAQSGVPFDLARQARDSALSSDSSPEIERSAQLAQQLLLGTPEQFDAKVKAENLSPAAVAAAKVLRAKLPLIPETHPTPIFVSPDRQHIAAGGEGYVVGMGNDPDYVYKVIEQGLYLHEVSKVQPRPRWGAAPADFGLDVRSAPSLFDTLNVIDRQSQFEGGLPIDIVGVTASGNIVTKMPKLDKTNPVSTTDIWSNFEVAPYGKPGSTELSGPQSAVLDEKAGQNQTILHDPKKNSYFTADGRRVNFMKDRAGRVFMVDVKIRPIDDYDVARDPGLADKAPRDKDSLRYSADEEAEKRPSPQEDKRQLKFPGADFAKKSWKPGAVAPTFYSQAEKTIEAKMPNKAPPAQIKAILRNPGSGIKAEELKWLGSDEFLDTPGVKTRTKEELLDFIRAGRMQILESEVADPKYDDYTLGGDEEANYRELLFTLPERVKTGTPEVEPVTVTWSEPKTVALAGGATKEWTASDGAVIHYQPGEDLPERYILSNIPGETYDKKVGSLFAAKKLHAEAAAKPAKAEKENVTIAEKAFKTPHFKGDNIVAHARLTDRVEDASGKKVLLIEEIQSDWHQEGREKGYKGDPGPAFPIGKIPVADAPFRKTWHEFVFKRLLRMAAETGKDFLAWTTGEQQGDRYDLRQRISRITYNPDDEQLYAYDHRNHQVISKRVAQDDLASVIGAGPAKAMERAIDNREYDYENHEGWNINEEVKYVLDEEARAYKKVLDEEGDEVITWRVYDGNGERVDPHEHWRDDGFDTETEADDFREENEPAPELAPAEISDDDLIIGGEGMVGFYDKMLVDYARKYGKKWGATHQGIDIAIGERGGETVWVHALDITPEMKKSVMQEGQALYSPDEAARAAREPAKETDFQREQIIGRGKLTYNKEDERPPLPDSLRYSADEEKKGGSTRAEQSKRYREYKEAGMGEGSADYTYTLDEAKQEITDHARKYPEAVPLVIKTDEKTGKPAINKKGHVTFEEHPYELLKAPGIPEAIAKAKEKFAPGIATKQRAVEALRKEIKKGGQSAEAKAASEAKLRDAVKARDAAKDEQTREARRAVAKQQSYKLEREWNKIKDEPEIQDAMKWYEAARVKFQKLFGANLRLWTEFLAATSPQTTVPENFTMSVDAIKGFAEGKYDRLIERYDKFLKDGGQPHKWKEVPLKSNDTRFNMVSQAVLRVMHRSWAETTKGPKTLTFADDLSGRGNDAVIDVWIGRLGRRLLYKGKVKQWRLLPAQEKGVKFTRAADTRDAFGNVTRGEVGGDYAFAQEIFAHAAERLKMLPDALQAGMWFGEKNYWRKKGWTKTSQAEDLTSYDIELRKLNKKGVETFESGEKSVKPYRMLTGYTTFTDTASFSKPIFHRVRAYIRSEVARMKGVLAARIHESIGLFIEEQEPTIDFEATFRDANSREEVERMIFDLAHTDPVKQSFAFASVVVNKSHPNARPGIEIGFKDALTLDQLKPMIAVFIEEGILGFTLAADSTGKKYTGFRAQYIPEIEGTYGAKSHLNPKNFEVNADAWLAKAKKAMKKTDPKLASHVTKTYYDTRVFAKDEAAYIPVGSGTGRKGTNARGGSGGTTIASELGRRARAARGQTVPPSPGGAPPQGPNPRFNNLLAEIQKQVQREQRRKAAAPLAATPGGGGGAGPGLQPNP